MNKSKASAMEHIAADPEDARDFLVERETQHSNAPLIIARGQADQTARSMATFRELQTVGKPRALKVAIKVKGKVLFVDLAEVVSIQAKGKHVSFQQMSGCHLLRESISVVAQKLETQGFIRIHRSVLVNTSFVEEIRPISTGKYSLRVAGGKEYTVTRIYRKNLKFLAECWIGAGAPFLG